MRAPQRSNSPEVRNPILALPAARRILSLPPELREALAQLLRELGAAADTKADECWARRKAPMAAYWLAAGVYSRHIARAVDPRLRPPAAFPDL